ncbi:BQ2448_4923 [Microbotryum intermedium]|uniref:BQ2448_4923 protein n=1 Tax=Microbotryum intermedium TaxID=269621 RepID=A0A238FHG0_9BASI|nr:BQ2448_4923 [Microbotryum intermedium]
MSSKPSQSTAAPEEDDEPELDLASFQLDLDESLAFAQALVRSWVPSRVDTEWGTTTNEGGGPKSLGQLTSRLNRLGRLGLGASATALHLQQAQDQKLRTQLLRHTKAHTHTKDDVEKDSTMNRGNARGVGGNEDDEEDSRSRAIRSRALTSTKASVGMVGIGKPNGRASTKKRGETTASSVSPAVKTPSPFLASSTPLETSSIPSTSFYDSNPTSSPLASTSALTTDRPFTTTITSLPDGNGIKLTKNQRKKERDREKVRLLKLEAMRESQKADMEGNGRKRGILNVEEGVKEEAPEAKKKKRKDKVSPCKNGKGLEGDEESSSDEAKDDNDEERLFGNGEGSPDGGTQNKNKKKRRRKKKKGGSNTSENKGGGVLNLGE